MDLVGSLLRLLEVTKTMMLTDCYTKRAKATALKDKTAITVAGVLYSVSFR